LLNIRQPPVGRPAAQLVPVGQLKLSEDRRDVRLDRLRRNAELAGDLLVRVASGDVAKDLALARGQLIELLVDRRARLAREGVQDESGQSRREHRIAAVDAGERVL
jgi:hypothetical protein